MPSCVKLAQYLAASLLVSVVLERVLVQVRQVLRSRTDFSPTGIVSVPGTQLVFPEPAAPALPPVAPALPAALAPAALAPPAPAVLAPPAPAALLEPAAELPAELVLPAAATLPALPPLPAVAAPPTPFEPGPESVLLQASATQEPQQISANIEECLSTA